MKNNQNYGNWSNKELHIPNMDTKFKVIFKIILFFYPEVKPPEHKFPKIIFKRLKCVCKQILWLSHLENIRAVCMWLRDMGEVNVYDKHMVRLVWIIEWKILPVCWVKHIKKIEFPFNLGIGKLSTGNGKHLADPDVLRRLTSSVSCALDEAAAALTRMRNENPRSQTETR